MKRTMLGIAAPIFVALCPALLLHAQDAPRHADLYVHFDTSMGEIVALLFPERAPVTVGNFVNLAEAKKATLTKDGRLVHRPFYNGLTFHRVIKGFMIQTGLVKEGLPCGGANIKDEIDSARSFATPFMLAMANAGHPNSANCQIFITVAPQRPLDGSYTIFGQVVSGQDVAERISDVPVKNDRPVIPVIAKTVTIERRAR
jgi:peptidyl-prolyl cis-trans isomerase A (cyclophilin A)